MCAEFQMNKDKHPLTGRKNRSDESFIGPQGPPLIVLHKTLYKGNIDHLLGGAITSPQHLCVLQCNVAGCIKIDDPAEVQSNIDPAW